MNASKNVGRKRLGRLPISGGSIGNRTKDHEAGGKISRFGSSHRVQQSNAKKQCIEPQASPDPEIMDLSFSTSFGGDDIISAVDKLERDYSNTKSVPNKTSIDVVGSLNAYSNTKSVPNKTSIDVVGSLNAYSNTKSVPNKTSIDAVGSGNDHFINIQEQLGSSKDDSEARAGDENAAVLGCRTKKKSQANSLFNVHLNKREFKGTTTSVLKSKLDSHKDTSKDENNSEKQLSKVNTNTQGVKHGRENSSKLRACQLKPEAKENIKSTPKSSNSRKKSRVSLSSSFLISPDLTWTSPQGISTPQEFQRKMTKAKRKSDASPFNALNSTSNGRKSNKRKASNVNKTKVEITPVRRKETNRNNRSDFFKSLFLDKSPDISVSPDTGDKILVDQSPDMAGANAIVDRAEGEKEVTAKTSSESVTNNCKNPIVLEKKTASKRGDDIDRGKSLNDNGPAPVPSLHLHTGDADRVQVLANGSGDVGNMLQSKERKSEGIDGIAAAEDEENEISMEVETGQMKVLHSDKAGSSNDLSLSSWGLPEPVLKQYHSRGIKEMFPWQAECLQMGNVLGGGNLVYSAPTSAGKTMVAELLVLKRVLETRKKAIIILPFVSVTREKMFYLQELYQDAGIRVSGFMGHYAPAGGFSSVDVAVCTIEKGNGLINRLLEENKLDKLGIIVVDELHLLGDSHRGYLLELMLTKICYMEQKNCDKQSDQAPDHNVQIVGMSATLPNLDLLAAWLNADLYRTDYRPVPLTECFKMGTALYDSSLNLLRDIDTTYTVKGDDDHVVPLCIETIREGHSILIFCPTKNWCEKLSETVAREFYNLLKSQVAVAGKDKCENSDVLVLPLDQFTLRDVVEQLRRTPVGLDSVLGRTVPFGVAYHHAGLTFDERDIVEGAFRQGILKVLIATSTLSSGVNLPARRVLIRTPVFHGQLIDFLTYKQMIGRAGRKGVDTAGESILLCKPNEKSKALTLVQSALPPVKSTLIRNQGEQLSSSMKRAILEVVVSGIAMAPKDVAMYASCTLLATSVDKEMDTTQDLIDECIAFLQENEFVCCQKVTENGETVERFVPTQLGAAVLASSLGPDEGLKVFAELQRARQCFVLENELHIIYLVTPIYAVGIGDSIDWYQYFCLWETLSAGMKRVAELVGVKESFLAKAVRGRILTKTDAQLKLLGVHKRFYTALVLHDLVHEMPINEVVRKYNCNKGQLQSLQQSAATFAGMVTVFCARLGWSNLELILSQFQNRLTFGVQRELCDLVRLSTLNGQRARVFYSGGYQTVAALASASVMDVEALLKNAAPFQSNKRQETETEWEAAERRKTHCIFLPGRKGMTEYEAAGIIIEEAKSLIQEELGGLGIQWNAKVPAPEMKSPVVTSPVPTRLPQSKKKGQRHHRRSSIVRKSTSPHNENNEKGKTDEKNNSPILCIISPPVKESGNKSKQQRDPSNKTNMDTAVISSEDDRTLQKNERTCNVEVKNMIVNSTTGRHKNELNTDDILNNISNASKNNNEVRKQTKVAQHDSRQNQTDHTVNSLKDVSLTKSGLKSCRVEVSNANHIDRNKIEKSASAKDQLTLISMKTKTKVTLEGFESGDNTKDVEGSCFHNVIRNAGIRELSEQGELRHMNSFRDAAQENKEVKNLNLRDSLNTEIQSIVTKTLGEKHQPDELQKRNDNLEGSVGCNKQELKVKTDQKSKSKYVKFSESPVAVINAPLKSAVDKDISNTVESSDLQINNNRETVNTSKPLDHDKEYNKMPSTDLLHSHTEAKCNDACLDIDHKNQTVKQVEKQITNLNRVNTVDKEACEKQGPETNENSCKLNENMDIESDVEKEFFDSFIVDSQIENIESKECGNVIMESSSEKTSRIKSNKELSARHDVKSLDEKPKNNFMKECLHSESLFTQDELYCSFNTSLEYVSEVNRDIQNKCIVNDNLNTPETGSGTVLNGCKTTPELDVNISDNGSNISDNDLEMNISESVVDASMELIAASNYDRVVCSNLSKSNDQDINDSYEDLHIPYQSGQEQCFETMDNHKHKVVSEDHRGIGKSGNLFGQTTGNNLLGQFSSPMPLPITGSYDNKDLQEDMAIALEMGDSFSCTLSTQVNAKTLREKESIPPDKDFDTDQFGDSLTLSMMDNALKDDSDENSLKTNEINLKSKQSCDNDKLFGLSKTTVNDLSCGINNNVISVIGSVHSSQENIEIIEKCSNSAINIPTSDFKKPDISPGTLSVLNSLSDTFVTPSSKPASKRLKQTPEQRTPKLRKTHAVDYSTPEGLDLDKKRTKVNRESTEKQLTMRKRIAKSGCRSVDDCSITIDVKKSRNSKLDWDRKNAEGNISDSLHNTSTESDFVPPTPPDESQLPSSPLPQHRTPKSSLRAMSPFSPKLWQYKSINAPQGKEKNIQSIQGKEKPKIENFKDGIKEVGKTQTVAEVSTIALRRVKTPQSFDHSECNSQEEESRNNEKEFDTGVPSVNEDKNASEDGDENVDENVEDEDKLPASFLDLNETGIPLTQSSFTVIDVCADKRLFKTFIMEWRTKDRYAVALACEKRRETVVPGSGIGGKFKKADTPSKLNTDNGGMILDDGLLLVGIAVSWENRDAYYIALTHEEPEGDPDDTLAPPPSDPDISLSIRQKAIKSVLQQEKCKDDEITMFIFDVKTQYRALVRGLGFPPRGKFEDPRIACWLLDPGASEKNLHRMVTNLLPTEVHMLHGIGGGIGYGSLGLNPQNPGSGRYRATTECVLVRHLAEYFRACLMKEDLYATYCDVEMPAALSLCRMELNGFGFSEEECESQKNVMIAKLSALEEQAYTLVGHPFSLSATEDIAQVLFIEIQLPPNGDPNAAPAARALAPNRRGGPRKGRQKCQFSTSKEVLEKLKKFHPLPGIILEWRRITNALTKVVFPLQKEKVLCSQLDMYRIFGECQLHSATGRVSLSEPNLQNIPKDFEIRMPDLIGESPPMNGVARQTRGGKSKLKQLIGQQQVARVTYENSASMFSVSMRHAFVPFKGGVLLAADYSQLELRMIAYLSRDEKLIRVLNEDGDVFKMITAQWKNIPVEEVSAEQRAQAKQVCYGMIYGIGPRALGEQLGVDENDAAAFIETFKAKYPGMRKYLRQTVDTCREKGYVETMLGRKRYLQSITGTNPHARAQAERQAVNTTVQGSAADLVKMAMIEIDRKLMEKFPDCQATHKQKVHDKKYQGTRGPPRGAYLVLQLHDELIYEVNERDVTTVTGIIKTSMEHAMDLPVKMPVKVKVGASWGRLQEI